MKITFQNRDEEFGPENTGFTYTLENKFRTETVAMAQRYYNTDDFIESYGDQKFQDRAHATIRELIQPDAGPVISFFEVRGKMYLGLGAAMEALRARVDKVRAEMARDTEESADGMF